MPPPPEVALKAMDSNSEELMYQRFRARILKEIAAMLIK
jgi:hypothetical protein